MGVDVQVRMAGRVALFFSISALSASLECDFTSPSLPWGIHIAQGAVPENEMSTCCLIPLPHTRFCPALNVLLPLLRPPSTVLPPAIMWSTRAAANTTMQYRAVGSAAWLTAVGDSSPFSDSGNTQTIHRVYLSGLTASTAYEYSVGSAAAASDVFRFTVGTSCALRPPPACLCIHCCDPTPPLP